MWKYDGTLNECNLSQAGHSTPSLQFLYSHQVKSCSKISSHLVKSVTSVLWFWVFFLEWKLGWTYSYFYFANKIGLKPIQAKNGVEFLLGLKAALKFPLIWLKVSHQSCDFEFFPRMKIRMDIFILLFCQQNWLKTNSSKEWSWVSTGLFSFSSLNHFEMASIPHLYYMGGKGCRPAAQMAHKI